MPLDLHPPAQAAALRGGPALSTRIVAGAYRPSVLSRVDAAVAIRRDGRAADVHRFTASQMARPTVPGFEPGPAVRVEPKRAPSRSDQ